MEKGECIKWRGLEAETSELYVWKIAGSSGNSQKMSRDKLFGEKSIRTSIWTWETR